MKLWVSYRPKSGPDYSRLCSAVLFRSPKAGRGVSIDPVARPVYTSDRVDAEVSIWARNRFRWRELASRAETFNYAHWVEGCGVRRGRSISGRHAVLARCACGWWPGDVAFFNVDLGRLACMVWAVEWKAP